MSLRIPEQHRASVVRIGELTADQVLQLEGALQEAPPLLDEDRFAAAVSSTLDFVGNGELKEILTVLRMLYGVRESSGVTIAKFIEDICEAMRRPGAPPDNHATDFDCEPLRQNLARLLGIPRLDLVSRAADLQSEVPNSFDSARVLTDLRPIFDRESGAEMEGAVVLHSLKINYWHCGELREIHVAMELEDVKRLRLALDRAITKTTTLQAFLKKTDLIELNGDIGK